MATGAKGAYDHPAYTGRTMVGRLLSAGASTSGKISFPCDMRIRNVSACATVAGTQTGWLIKVLNGTNSVGVISMGGTAAIGAVATSGDCNSTLPAGTLLQFENVAEATGVAHVMAEMHNDPAGTFSA